jgi:uncharacterized protein (TIGR04255 family)
VAHQYKNSPITEAVCEFLFDGSGETWDFTVPGRLYELLKGEYPGRPREQTVIRPGSLSGTAEPLDVIRTSTRVQLVNESQNRIVGCGRNSLSVHSQPPYDGWEAFRSQIVNAITAYDSLIPGLSVRRVGVRYINRITVEGHLERLAGFVSVSPLHVDGIRTDSFAYHLRTEARYLDDSGRLLVTVGTADAPEGHSSVIIDIDVVWEADEPLPLMECLDHVEDNKRKVTVAFESLITDEARRNFDA